jgi:hypothetical protein
MIDSRPKAVPQKIQMFRLFSCSVEPQKRDTFKAQMV